MIASVAAEKKSSSLEAYFSQFRKHIIGIDQEFETPYGVKKLVYTDWTASGRLYRPIEEKLINDFGPYVANTHTETTVTGTAMTLAYKEAKRIIKRHVNANADDVLLLSGTGMTGAINKFQRILGLRLLDNLKKHTTIPDHIRPVVFISHMEHHSNQTSWLETIAKVEVIPPSDEGLFCIKKFTAALEKHKDRVYKIASITACSNVTGLQPCYYDVAKLMHQHGGVCFVDFACSAPYVDIDMHPENDEDAYLDAIFFSPHKFLGGPGTPGALIFNKKLYNNMVPDNPGGGTVAFTNPWGEHKYFEDIEEREDGGTPGFLQTIKTALAIQLKDAMGTANIIAREHEILNVLFDSFTKIPNLHILAKDHKDRLGVLSFYIEDLHYNLGVKLLNDRFGIQTRGGCSCAGTYGHYLLNVDYDTSHKLTNEISCGNLEHKPGWIRLSIHPTLSCDEMRYVCKSVKALAKNHKDWAKDYNYNSATNEYTHHAVSEPKEQQLVKSWFGL